MGCYYGRSKKSKSIKVHFRRRCIERVGHYLDNSDITQRIQKGELEFLYKRSNNRTIFKYIDEETNRVYGIVYDKKRKIPVTIYPLKTQNAVKKYVKSYEK